MSQGLSSDIRIFISEHIDSVEQLEVLLLLSKDPARTWSLDQLINELRSSKHSIRKRLDDLCAMRLVHKVGDEPAIFQYLVNPKLDKTVRELASVYRQFRLAVIDLIFRKPHSKMLRFSQAFRLKGDDDVG